MTIKERFLATLNFEKTDRPVRMESMGYWNETFARWIREGLPGSATNQVTAHFYFGMDPMVPIILGADVHPGFDPLFEEKILKDDGRRVIKRDITGSVVEVLKDGTSSVPGYIEFPVKDWATWEDVKKRLDPSTPARLGPQWDPFFALAETQQLPLMVAVSGLFGFLRHLFGFEPLMEMYYDKPDLIHAISRHWACLWKEVIALANARHKLDAVSFWEDMCGKNGPIISPAMFREFMTPYYAELIAFLRDELGVPCRGVDTDGDMTLLIPLFVEVGINLLWPFEVQAGMDVKAVRKEWPSEFMIWGGIDKRALAWDKDAIRAEVMRVLPYMLEKGGYIPGLDHSVPPDVSYENFRYYVALTREIGKQYAVHR